MVLNLLIKTLFGKIPFYRVLKNWRGLRSKEDGERVMMEGKVSLRFDTYIYIDISHKSKTEYKIIKPTNKNKVRNVTVWLWNHK